ncbi:MAG: LytTR family DNA-binding domain-containing protein [Pedobacter sp.]|nr:LytTR family DNA-binding domain-containing protein [Pedobacter sp.]MDQ8054325.1 LytTR family DNA-binding domain-containing protein [Pedobacter sp.]
MKVLKCVAIDDEPLALRLISTYASRIPSIDLVTTFEDAISGAAYLSKNEIDLVFLDINMPDISGLDLARALEKKPLLIFTTAYREFAFEGFELEAVDYLLKPISFENFSKACQKAIDYRQFKDRPHQVDDDSHFFVYAEYRQVKVLTREIAYIESMEDYIKIHRDHQKPLLTLMTMKKVLELLPENKFARIHRSYAVPLSRIKSIQHKKIQLDGIELPIGDAFAAQLNLVKGKGA